MDVPIRKAQAGSTSLGYTWPEDGAVVKVSPEDAVVLTGIPDGGFTVADDSWAEPETPADDDPPQDPPAPVEPPVNPEFAEVIPDPEAAEPKPAPAKKAAARKTTASKE